MSDSHPFLDDEFQIKWSTLTPEHISTDVTKAIEAGKAILLEREEIIRRMDAMDIAFIAIDPSSLTLDPV